MKSATENYPNNHVMFF